MQAIPRSFIYSEMAYGYPKSHHINNLFLSFLAQQIVSDIAEAWSTMTNALKTSKNAQGNPEPVIQTLRINDYAFREEAG